MQDFWPMFVKSTSSSPSPAGPRVAEMARSEVLHVPLEAEPEPEFEEPEPPPVLLEPPELPEPLPDVPLEPLPEEPSWPPVVLGADVASDAPGAELGANVWPASLDEVAPAVSDDVGPEALE
ncbi:hypothetical protein AB0399_32840, partial [Streptomyces sp. NPDC088194]|uniref:hypothetical protein n=1 Tax=Streptomyces sp. NPDC088194 TaxID=3154931 RepID=UPI00344C86C5